jgi:transcriptional regulator GlxA family with amidase domain
MKNKDLTMKEISKLSGFANERQLQHTFKKKFEAAPADFRNKLWDSS